jgi:hypothetical protein
MPHKDDIAKRGRGQEEEYFRRKDQELLDQMRRKAAQAAELRELATAAGIEDGVILRDLQAMGFTAATVALLPLAPLVQVAWAEGQVSPRERELILEAVAASGIAPGTPGHEQLLEWLTRRPSEAFLEGALRACQSMISALPEQERHARWQALLAACTGVAQASRGAMGLGRRISDEEQRLLDRIAALLERAAPQ